MASFLFFLGWWIVTGLVSTIWSWCLDQYAGIGDTKGWRLVLFTLAWPLTLYAVVVLASRHRVLVDEARRAIERTLRENR